MLAVPWPAMVMGVLGDGNGSFSLAVLSVLVLYGCGLSGGIVGIVSWRRAKHSGKAIAGLVTGIIAVGLAGLLILGMSVAMLSLLLRTLTG